MKQDTNRFVALCLVVAIIAIAPAFVLHRVNAQGAGGFGKLEAQLRHLAHQDTDRFLDAMKASIQAIPTSARATFKTTLLAELGLDRFAADQERIEELERIRAILEPIAENPDALMADLIANIQITPEAVADGGP